MRIVGSRKRLRGEIRAHADHRLAMSFAILGAADGNDIRVDDPECVAVSYPRFWKDLARVTGRA
jgi:3-phosphoshikimate 1-carboxyvinyltransferase